MVVVRCRFLLLLPLPLPLHVDHHVVLGFSVTPGGFIRVYTIRLTSGYFCVENNAEVPTSVVFAGCGLIYA